MNDRVDEVYDSIKRSDFVKAEPADNVELEQPITIDNGQTSSNPSSVRGMLKWLDIEPGQKVLSVGTGMGWTTTLLSKLVGDKGQVVAVEASPEVLKQAQHNSKKQGLQNVTFHHGDEEEGWRQEAPYDRILVSASLNEAPPALLAQLAPDGKIVVPVIDEILEISKDEEDTFYRTPHSGAAFVPLMNCAD